MSLTDLSSLGSFVSGVAVVITLIMLLLQMRQTDRNQRAAIGMGRATRANDLFAMMVDPDANRAITKAYRCVEELNDDEAYSFMFFCAALLTNLEDTYVQHLAGLLESGVWETEEAIVKVNIAHVSFRAMWPFVRDLYGEGFRRYVENMMEQVHVGQPAALASIFNVAVREQLAQARSSG